LEGALHCPLSIVQLAAKIRRLYHSGGLALDLFTSTGS